MPPESDFCIYCPFLCTDLLSIFPLLLVYVTVLFCWFSYTVWHLHCHFLGFFIFLFSSHWARISTVIHGLFLGWYIPSTSFDASVSTALKVEVTVSTSISLFVFISMISGASLSPNSCLKFFRHPWIFQLFTIKVNMCLFALGNLFNCILIIVMTRSWSEPISPLGKLHVLAIFTDDWKHFLTIMLSIWLWCFPFGLCQVHILDFLCCSYILAIMRSLKSVNLSSLSPHSLVSAFVHFPHMPGHQLVQPVPTLAFQSPCTTMTSLFGIKSTVDWSCS